MENYYGETLFTDIAIINRVKYKGRGRPRLIDYMSLREAQKQVNTLYNMSLSRKDLPHAK